MKQARQSVVFFRQWNSRMVHEVPGNIRHLGSFCFAIYWEVLLSIAFGYQSQLQIVAFFSHGDLFRVSQ